MIGAVRNSVALTLSALCLSFSHISFAEDFSNNKISKPVISDQDIVILQPEDMAPTNVAMVKTIVVGDSVRKHTYAELLTSARQMAKNENANIIKLAQRVALDESSISQYLTATLYYSENPRQYERQFSWHPDRKLTWNDFRGPVLRDMNDIRAAGTFCGIGFETNSLSEDNSNIEVHVYNTFYVDKSWIKELDKDDHILAHEQGHFDLCELYTRKMRAKLNDILRTTDRALLKNAIEQAYTEVQYEYGARQQLYEDETAHGVIYNVQARWQADIAKELKETEQWTESNIYVQK